MAKDLRLSPRHGVNPAIPFCFFCNEPKNEVILAGLLPNDQEAPRAAIWNKDPCDKCAAHMKAGIILISVRNGESGNNPYRTGGWCVIKESALRRFVQPQDLADDICLKRVAFLEDQTWDALGLPRGPLPEGDQPPCPSPSSR